MRGSGHHGCGLADASALRRRENHCVPHRTAGRGLGRGMTMRAAVTTGTSNEVRDDLPDRTPGPGQVQGPVAWLAWVVLHVVILTGQRNRLATLANLSVRYLPWP